MRVGETGLALRDTKRQNMQKMTGATIKWTLFVATIFSLFALLMIVLFLLYRGIPAMADIGFFKFLFGTTWDSPSSQYGILPALLGSLYVTALATVMGVAIGVFSAIFLHRFCKKRFVGPIVQAINILAGIPSVVFGIFGLLVVVPFIQNNLSPDVEGHGILAASIILSIMIAPTVISISLNALKSIPKELFEGALALGASIPQAEFCVVVPAAKGGILAASVLSIGRAIGETMAVMMVIGGDHEIPKGLMQSINTMTALIAGEAREAGGLWLEALIATGILLFVFSLVINFVFMRIRAKVDYRFSMRSKKKNRSPMETLAKSLSVTVLGVGKAMDSDHAKPSVDLSKLFFVDHETKKSNRKKIKFDVLKVLSCVGAGITLVFLASILVFIAKQGVSSLSWHFLFGEYSVDNPSIKPALLGSAYLILISLLIAVPIGIAAAVYMSEYMSRRSKFIKYLRMSVETLASIPSIVYGLFGYILFGSIFGWGYSFLGAGITLAIMVLPGIIRTTEEGLLSVHNMYREGSFALGASKARTTFRVVVPQAASGILTSVILAIGRVVSESAVLLLTLGLVPGALPDTMGPGTSMALDIFYFATQNKEGQAAAAATVLILFVVVINLGATQLAKLLSRKTK